MKIYCCGCGCEVAARLSNGGEIYPHRPDLVDLPVWKCDGCGNYVGCHHKTSNRTKPLGCIPTPEIRAARKRIHALLDPIWKRGKVPRGKLYCMLGAHLGREYHTGELRSMDEVGSVIRFIEGIAA